MSPVPYLVALAPAILLIVLLCARLAVRSSRSIDPSHDRFIAREPAPTPILRVPVGSADLIDIETELRAIIGRLEPAARNNVTKLRHAFRHVGMAYVDTPTLRDVLTTITATAIRNSFGGQVLLTARPVGRWIEIAVTDDGPVRDDATRHVQLDDARSEAAARGWLFSTNTRTGFGTTVSIRLPAAETAPQPRPPREELHQDTRAGELVAVRD